MHSPTAGHAERAATTCATTVPFEIAPSDLQKNHVVVAGHCSVMEMTTSEAVLALLRSVCQAARLRS